MALFSPAIQEFLAAPANARRLGPYLCKDVLDKAGTAPVFRAVEEHAGHALREVAVKVFDIGAAGAAKEGVKKAGAAGGWQARVLEEARSLCRVQHPNVVRFHTLATDPKRGLMGIVMELAEGVSVATQLEELPRGDARRLPLAVEVGIHVAGALGAAHAAGVVHCNVKPSNIMLTGGTHKLINFGIAASLGLSEGSDDEPRKALVVEDLPPDSVGQKAATLLRSADAGPPISGTVGYLDPVCVKTTAPPTTSSDLYALGATLYSCLAGDAPALATAKKRGAATLDAKVLTGEAAPAPIAELAPSTPPALAKLVDALVAPTREARPRSAEGVLHTLERIRSALAGHDRTLPPVEHGPFPGLARYGALERDVFFGRSPEIAGMIELLRTRGLVGIVGLSGTGKSSLARAGVIPAIEDGALGGWPTTYRRVALTPGADLAKALREALAGALEAPLEPRPEAAMDQLAADVDARGVGLLILIDQLEEIVTRHPADATPEADAARLDALDLLARLAEAPIGLRVVVTARRDQLDEILAIDARFARALSRGIQLLGPVPGAAWEEIVDRSLEAYDHTFEDEALRRDVLADLRKREGAMGLAQFGLSRLWAARDAKKKVIPRAAFDARGGMRGALDQHGDATVAELSLDREKLRELLLAMTTPEGTRAHMTREELRRRFKKEGEAALDTLLDAQLLVEDDAGVTFAHDSVIRDWTLLRNWLEAARDDRMLAAHIERDAARWSESRDAVELWRKGRLVAAIDLWKRGVSLSDNARAFVKDSSRVAQRNQFALWCAIASVLLVIVGGSLAYAKESADHAAQAQRDADALAQALAQVKALKQQAEEAAGEASASAELLHDLQKKLTADQASYGAEVKATLKKVANATDLSSAKEASAALDARAAPTTRAVVPLPSSLTGGPTLDTSGPSGPSASPSAGAFDEGAIVRVVNAHKAGVKRTCLERSGSTASSTKVTATITIAASGQVKDVTTKGNDPVVASCIQKSLRSWSFPAPGEVKQVEIPFVFVRQ